MKQAAGVMPPRAFRASHLLRLLAFGGVLAVSVEAREESGEDGAVLTKDDLDFLNTFQDQAFATSDKQRSSSALQQPDAAAAATPTLPATPAAGAGTVGAAGPVPGEAGKVQATLDDMSQTSDVVGKKYDKFTGDVKTKAAGLKDSYGQIRQEGIVTHGKNEKLKKEIADLNARAAKTRAENQKLAEEIKAFRDKANKLTQENGQLKQNVAQLKKEIADLTAKEKALTTELGAETAKRNKLEESYKHLLGIAHHQVTHVDAAIKPFEGGR